MEDSPKKTKIPTTPEKSKEYYKTHSNKNREPLICESCGVKYNYYSKSKHLRSDRHQLSLLLTDINVNDNVKQIINKVLRN